MSRTISLGELAAYTAAQLHGDSSIQISGVNSLEEASSGDASFLDNPRYREVAKRSAAGVICIAPDIERDSAKNYLVSPSPSRTFQKIIEYFFPCQGSGFTGIHPTAVVHETALIGADVTIGPYAVIDRDVSIASGTTIGAHVFIGHEVRIGSHCILYPTCVVREKCQLGNRVIVQPGAVIGSCGFGFLLNAQGQYQKLEQLGNVVIEDDVEIGANTTIDRARFKTTRVRCGAKIDNLCQIAHNVEVGEHTAMAAQTGIAGSSKTGKYVVLGGQVGVAGHVQLDDRVMVSSQSGVSKSLKSGKYRGSPAIPIDEYHRQEVRIRKLEESGRRLKELEQRLNALLSQGSSIPN